MDGAVVDNRNITHMELGHFAHTLLHHLKTKLTVETVALYKEKHKQHFPILPLIAAPISQFALMSFFLHTLLS